MVRPPWLRYFIPRQVAWSPFLLPHPPRSCTLIRIWRVTTARQASRGPTESVENSCRPKTDPCVTAKVLTNPKNKKRSCFSTHTHQTSRIAPTHCSPLIHDTRHDFNSGGILQDFRNDLCTCILGLNCSPVWAKIKMRLNQMVRSVEPRTSKDNENVEMYCMY